MLCVRMLCVAYLLVSLCQGRLGVVGGGREEWVPLKLEQHPSVFSSACVYVLLVLKEVCGNEYRVVASCECQLALVTSLQ